MTIKIVTLNIWLGGLLQEQFLSFLESQKADILLLQEVHNGEDPTFEARYRTMQVLKARLGFPYEQFAPEYLELNETQGRAQVGNAVLSTFPIVHSAIIPFLPYSESYRDVPGNYHRCPYNMQHVVLSSPVGELNVFNIHGIWDLDGDNFSPLRKKMSELVIEAVKDKRRVILAGDTNARPTNQAMINIGKYLHNIFGSELKTTFNMKHKDDPGYGTSVVDMMFVSSDIQVLARDCPDVDVSDHLPLTATLRIL